MTVQIPFELPFERCTTCLAFDPMVKRSDYKINEKFEVSCKTEFRCKGEKFCRYREETKDDE